VVDPGSHDGRSLARVMTEKLALVAFRVVGSPDRRSHATVRISRGGRDHAEAEAEGNGPMDALFRATDAAVGVRGEVTGLRIYAFDTYDMVGKARITVSFEGRKYAGRGSSPDAVEAAAHAYLRAVAAYLSDEGARTSAV
jgi:2-isopropylmalate synthase